MRDIYYISVITLYEYPRGSKNSKEVKKLLEESFAMVSLNNEVLLKSLEMWRDLKTKGILIDDRDLIVGATAIVLSLSFLRKTGAISKD